MDKEFQKSNHDLPLTPRVSEKVAEYYTKFGRGRDLEKFMRLYSPATSTSTSTSYNSPKVHTSKSNNSRKKQKKHKHNKNNNSGLKHGSNRHKKQCNILGSHSMPNISNTKLEKYFVDKCVTVPIAIEMEASEEYAKSEKKTLQPESSRKAHKRLEWDSLGDIGYKKSVSTLTLTYLEKSLLQALFKQSNDNLQSSTPNAVTRKVHDFPQSSSNNVERVMSPSISSTELQDNTNIISQSTHMKENQKIENYCQTTLLKSPEVCSKEVQVNLSSTNSVMESTTTPSSFEYKSKESSRASHSNYSKNKDNTKNESITSNFDELFINRRTLGEKNQQQDYIKNTKNIHTNLLGAINDKENEQCIKSSNTSQSSSCLTNCTTELDMGAQLICALLNSKSINEKQKKRLVRDIVKRISRLNKGKKMQLSSLPQQSCTKTFSDVSEHSVSAILPLKHNTTVSNIELPRSTQTDDDSTESFTTFLKGIMQFCNNIEASTANNSSSDNSLIQILVYKQRPENIPNQTEQTSSSTPTSNKTIEKDLQKSTADVEKNNSASVSSISSNKMQTQQDILNSKEKHLNADETMNEWLNPLTKSEIEYEQRKQTYKKSKKPKPQNHNQRVAQNIDGRHFSEQCCGREEQLSWIENEIKRLECLKYLLLKSNVNSIEQTSSTLSGKCKGESTTTKTDLLSDAIYDSIISDQSVTSKNESDISAINIKEIEVIIKESNEDVINLNDNLKRAKERKCETQSLYENVLNNKSNVKNKPPKCHSTQETTSVAEEQLLMETSHSDEGKEPRKKIDTPLVTTDSSNYRDSLKQLVQQRKREFLKLYNNKKQQQHDANSKLSQNQEKPKYFNILINHPEQQHLKNKTLQQKTKKKIRNSTDENSIREKCVTQPQSNSKSRSITTQTTSSSTIYNSTSTTSTPLITQNSISNQTTSSHHNEHVSVAIQTAESILQSIPIYGPQLIKNNRKKNASIAKTYRTNKSVSNAAGVQVKPKSIAYVIEFKENENSTILNGAEEVITLKDYLEKAKPKFIERYHQRQKVLQQMQEMQQARDRQLREIIDNTSFNSLKKHIQTLPPPPTERLRVLSTKQMKALTHKRFTKLPEVVARKQREREDKLRRNNRKLRDLFNQRLLERVRKGQISLNHSKTII